MDKKRRRSFTLRFEDEKTHELLTLLSNRLGVSMNRLAETMIQNEIQGASFAMQEDLSHTLARLAEYRGDSRAMWRASRGRRSPTTTHWLPAWSLPRTTRTTSPRRSPLPHASDRHARPVE